MAKGTRYGGASFTNDELADPSPPIRIRRAELGVRVRKEVAPSVGNSSIQSSEKENSPNDSETLSDQLPALTMVNHSDQPAAESDSIAHSTDGVGPKKQARPSARKRQPRVTDISFEEFNE